MVKSMILVNKAKREHIESMKLIYRQNTLCVRYVCFANVGFIPYHLIKKENVSVFTEHSFFCLVLTNENKRDIMIKRKGG